jgi:hypothetical protein
MLLELKDDMLKSTSVPHGILFIFILLLITKPVCGQGTGRYWDQNFNSEAALLSGAVVAGEGGIAAIYYNPATISEMKRNNLSLSANLFSVYFFKADNALGLDFPADRTQFDIYPRIITLTLNPKKNQNLTIELAFFTKSNEYAQVNSGTSQSSDIIAANPGVENYTGEYYLRSKFQDYYGGAGFGYKLSNSFSLGFTSMISYKDDQFYNLVTTNAFTVPSSGNQDQYLSDASYQLKYSMFDVRLITKVGLHYKKDSWALGANINFPSVKLFGDGTVVKQYEYSNIHKETGNPEGSDLYYGGRQKNCIAHFKDPLSIVLGANYYSPSGKSILLFTTEYFFGIPTYDYIEASNDPGEEGYNFNPFEAGEWLSFAAHHNPVLNAGVAFKQQISNDLMFSGGFRTDFRYFDPNEDPGMLEMNKRTNYNLNVYHFNYGFNRNFKRGAITLGMQFSYGQEKNQLQVVNLSAPVEYIGDDIMPLTGPLENIVTVRFYDLSIYLGFLFNFMKDEK